MSSRTFKIVGPHVNQRAPVCTRLCMVFEVRIQGNHGDNLKKTGVSFAPFGALEVS